MNNQTVPHSASCAAAHRPVAFHPFLLACFSVVYLYSCNMNQLPLRDIAVLLGLVGLAALALVIAAWLLRDDGRAMLVLTMAIICVFSYGHVRSWLDDLMPQAGFQNNEKDWFFYLWIIACILAAVAAVILPRRTRFLTALFNAASVALMALCLLTCAIDWISSQAARRKPLAGEWQQLGLAPSRRPERLPDIYYLIFDRYAGEQTLREKYQFDNSEFLHYLSSRGFQVAHRSNANYLKTALSLLASLNFEYLDHFTESPGRRSTSWLPAYQALEDYRVWRFLKTFGYHFHHFGSWWEPTSRNRFADRSYNVRPLREFTMVWWKTTLLYPCFAESADIKKFLSYNERGLQYQRTLYTFSELSRLPSQPSPKFVFAHVLVPHDPYVFEPDGSFVPDDVAYHRPCEISYRHQVMYVNTRIRELVDTILARSAQPPIIIIQSDEGPYPDRFKADEKRFKWRTATRAEIRQKMGILNALYLPGADSTLVYDTLSPVNIFRIVFNTYFHTSLPLLPDRSYAFSDGLHPYDFFDCTEQARQITKPMRRSQPVARAAP